MSYYLLKYQRHLAYDAYLGQGYPIATGVIEGACRSLIKDRMDITGARWGLAGGEAVLKVRSLRASGDLDADIDFHIQRERQRNHLSTFDEGELIELRPRQPQCASTDQRTKRPTHDDQLEHDEAQPLRSAA